MVALVSAEQALARLPAEERAWILEFRDRLRSEYGSRLRDLRLFGSKARGDAHKESDIDLLVLLADCDWAAVMRIVDLAASVSPWLSANVFDFESYHAPVSRATGFYKEMRKESVRL